MALFAKRVKVPPASTASRSRRGKLRRNPAELLVLGNPRRRRKANPAELVVLGGNPAPKRRRNSATEDLYREFQGKEPSKVTAVEETQAMPRHAAVLGDLVALGFGNVTEKGEELHGDALAIRWKECSHVSFAGDDVKLASDGAGTQLFLVGGQQELTKQTLRALGGEAKSGRSKLGPLFYVVYNTRKAQDNFEGGQYTHEFAEDGGRRPTAYYEADIERIVIRGGSYQIEDRGIVN